MSEQERWQLTTSAPNTAERRTRLVDSAELCQQNGLA